MVDYVEEIKEFTKRLNDEMGDPEDEPDRVAAITHLQYLIRRLEEREHKVRTLNDQLKGCKRK